MPKASTNDQILTIKQVAEFLKVTERTIYRLAASKKIPAFKVGGAWRFALTDIDAWIRRQSIVDNDSGRSDETSVSGKRINGERK